jgi:hypothetical protein
VNKIARYGIKTVQSIKLSIQSTLNGHTWKRVWVTQVIAGGELYAIQPARNCWFFVYNKHNMNDNWSKLSHLQLGKYGEYFAKMEFTKAGFDVYTSEVDDKGIDFVIRKNESEHYDVQVKSVRNYNYVFMRKEVFNLRNNLLLALILFEDDSLPTLCLVPSLEWKNNREKFFCENDYENKKSRPEWGLKISKANADEFKQEYSFEKQTKPL